MKCELAGPHELWRTEADMLGEILAAIVNTGQVFIAFTWITEEEPTAQVVVVRTRSVDSHFDLVQFGHPVEGLVDLVFAEGIMPHCHHFPQRIAKFGKVVGSPSKRHAVRDPELTRPERGFQTPEGIRPR